jgi:PIN domain nuclease of toxin-antitoxin system
MTVLLDTHVWIWWVLGQRDLPRRQRAKLDAMAMRTPPLVSDVSLWEAQMMFAKKRLPLDMPFDRWLYRATRSAVVTMIRITPSVAVQLNELPPDFNADPADRIIVATALAAGVPLLTYDRKIRSSNIVPLWN